MPGKIMIKTDRVEMEAELNDTRTAGFIWEQLPLKGRVNTWGEEIYFGIPVNAELENAVSVVEKGDLAYWPEGKSFCIFFGRTPASTGEEIRPAGPVNPVGRLLGKPEDWKQVVEGSEITLAKSCGSKRL